MHKDATLRDWLAAMAIAGVLGPGTDLDDVPEFAAGVAEAAYLIADEMIKARAKQPEPATYEEMSQRRATQEAADWQAILVASEKSGR